MDGVHELRLRADRSRRAGFEEPVVASVAEARALAARVADQVACLPDHQRLLVLAHLDDVCGIIQARLEKLQAELAVGRRQIAAANDGGTACASYAASRGPAG